PILARCTPMKVTEVSDNKRLQLKPDSVYVIAPDRKLELLDGTVGAGPLEEPLGRRSAIDLFFRSLADSHGDGYAISLSGRGSEGGGVVVVEGAREAQHEGMPRSVIGAEVADVVLPVRELASRLAELVQARTQLSQLVSPSEVLPDADAHDEAALKRIFELVRS